MDVSIVIPMHNEREALPDLLKALRSFWETNESQTAFEFLLIDDGSTDETFDFAWREADRFPAPMKVARLSPQEGLGGAVRAGFSFASGEIVVTYDADLPYPLTDLPRLVAAVKAGADIATASPYHPDGIVEGVSAYRLIPSQVVSSLYRLRLLRYPRLFTYTCGFRAYRRSILEAIVPTASGFLATSQMICKGLRAGLSIEEIPSCLRQRTKGTSKMRVLRTALTHLRYLVGAR
jgi:dolichol-phosphate mannosyltransferase